MCTRKAASGMTSVQGNWMYVCSNCNILHYINNTRTVVMDNVLKNRQQEVLIFYQYGDM
jgi:Zn-finger protein